MPFLFHICAKHEWPPATSSYRGDTLDTDGFIHCSMAGQLVAVANRFFHGRRDLTVLVIDESRVRANIVYENLEGGTEPFPHIYGPLDTEAVIGTFALPPADDGRFTEPGELNTYQGDTAFRP
jgi:uncharacterized protein (DUF952 family)